jgi:hypothetical protein
MSAATIAKALGGKQIGDADALDDRLWFCERPQRLFCARAGDGGVWLIRRRPQSPGPDVYLRTFSQTAALSGSDTDGELAGRWYRAACPDLPHEKCRKQARRSLGRPGR